MEHTTAFDWIGYPNQTTTGPRCGCCHGRHWDARAVRDCHDISRQGEEQAEADYRAEQANERALEDRGYWEARAQEDYEEAMGVIPFHVAMADALAAA